MAVKRDYELGYEAGVSQTNDDNASEIRRLQAELKQARQREADDKLAFKQANTVVGNLEADKAKVEAERDALREPLVLLAAEHFKACAICSMPLLHGVSRCDRGKWFEKE